MWLDVLKDLSPEDLRYGYRKLVVTQKPDKNGQFWPPNALEFRALCRRSREDFGLPSTGLAHREACANQYLQHGIWSHKAVQHAAIELGGNVEDARAFADVYDVLCARVMRGEVLSLPARARRALPTRSVVAQKEAMQKIRRLLKIKNISSEGENNDNQEDSGE